MPDALPFNGSPVHSIMGDTPMISFAHRPKLRASRAGSHFALAIALISGAAVASVAIEAPAQAAKKEKKEEAPKTNYSKAFVETYKPIGDAIEAGTDVPALKANIPQLLAAVSTDDDKMAAGRAIYSIGLKSEDVALQRQGLDMMIDSGKVAPDALPQNIFAAGQLAYNDGDYATARARFQQAAEAGYTANDPQALIAESYFAEENNAEGLAALDKAVSANVAAGADVPEQWLKRGLAVAYESELPDQTAHFSELLIEHYPSVDAWGDAIAILRNTQEFDNNEVLDLLRLGRLTNSLRYAQDYNEYLSAADPRRLPAEVVDVIKAGTAAGTIKANDVLVAEASKDAEANLAGVKADLPKLEADAKSSPNARIAMNAGEALLGFGEAPRAEAMFALALTKPGVDSNAALTRLGMAQVMQGKAAEAKATLAKVAGNRKPIADLWTLYADQKSAPPAA